VQTTPHIKSGKLRALGTGGLTRNRFCRRAGDRGSRRARLRGRQLVGLVAPAGTPPPSSRSCTRSIAAVQETDEVKKQFASEGARSCR
jgi:tripartite-type tricarboxylate transporter receptor subunit TctC